MLPTIEITKLGDYLKTISFDEFNLYGVVKDWIHENLVENPPEHYVKMAVNALIDENMI